MDKLIRSWDVATGESVTVKQQDFMKSQKVMVICSMPRKRTIKNLAMKKRLYDLVKEGKVTLQGSNPDFLQDEYLAEFIDR